MFIYDRLKNTFPEEVFIHEFLHSLEYVSKEAGIEYPLIHNYSDYGYENETAVKLKGWYTDFLNYEILNPNTNEYCGLDERVYALANPVDNSDFIVTYEVEFDNEPENIVEAIQMLYKTVKFNINNLINMIKEENNDNLVDENNIYTNEIIENVIN